jgi:hypothetical protein
MSGLRQDISASTSNFNIQYAYNVKDKHICVRIIPIDKLISAMSVSTYYTNCCAVKNLCKKIFKYNKLLISNICHKIAIFNCFVRRISFTVK